MNDALSSNMHEIRKIRRETTRRVLSVVKAFRLTPSMVRVVFAGPDLNGFETASYDDHVKLFFPAPSQSDPTAMVGRDYTPQRFDEIARTLEIDFFIHAAGPASDWASRAKPGDTLLIGGPRGSTVVCDDFHFYLLAGDETALPAIRRRLRELRPGVPAFVFAEVASESDAQEFESHAALNVTWLYRGSKLAGTTNLLETALSAFRASGDGYAFVACESAVAKRARRVLVEDVGIPKAWVRAAGYWRSGAQAVHDTHDG
jgi:NADPH-dependent ferric siderophore reductase